MSFNEREVPACTTFLIKRKHHDARAPELGEPFSVRRDTLLGRTSSALSSRGKNSGSGMVTCSFRVHDHLDVHPLVLDVDVVLGVLAWRPPF